MCITKDVNKRKLNPLGRCALLQVLRGYDKRCNRGRIQYNPQGEAGLDDPACGCLLGRKEGERVGPTLPPPRQTVIGSFGGKSPLRAISHLSH